MRIDQKIDPLRRVSTSGPHHFCRSRSTSEDHILDLTVTSELQANLLSASILPNGPEISVFQQKD
jgi:hypothetical protein